MKAEIITIGDEILIGQIVDSNSAWMAQQLNDAGIHVAQITSVSDNKEHILEALKLASGRAQIVLMTGGLGPTKDDITKSALCTYFNTELVMDEALLKHVKNLFDSFGAELLDVNKKQAEMPANCEVLINQKGTAAGMWFDHEGIIYVSMPGVPYEMKALMEEQVIPKLQKKFKSPHIVHKTILTQGVGESFLAEKIADWEDSLAAEDIKLAYLPSPGIVRLRLSSTGEDEASIKEKIDRKADELNALIPSYIYGSGDDTLESVVGDLMTSSDKTVATAESCTGGYIAHLITSVAGSSKYFVGSVVAYSNEIKENALNVDPALIESNGAVSEEVVKAMAEGIHKNYKTDYAISCSGIAGPDGGTEDKPVGTVWICVTSDKSVVARVFQFGTNRKRTIRITALTALNMLRKLIVEE
ncbi:competence/damage-inducible protein A [Flavobacteriales bacterium AH-315-E23]|nr:competence/damage-inducible protein A [Flavobacteriales bacterium AH-315-E23]